MKYALVENDTVTAIRSDSHPDFRLQLPWVDITNRPSPIDVLWTYDVMNDSFSPPVEE